MNRTPEGMAKLTIPLLRGHLDRSGEIYQNNDFRLMNSPF